MWCICHFAANIWKKQHSKLVIKKLKALCKVKEEKKFDTRLKELEKTLSTNATSTSLTGVEKHATLKLKASCGENMERNKFVSRPRYLVTKLLLYLIQ
jgi:hypothetical protein